MESSLLVARLCSLFALLLGTVLFGLLPLAVRNRLRCEGHPECTPNCRCQRGKRVIAFLIFFGGGVLLGTTLLHLLPEAREGFEEKKESNVTVDGGDDDDDGEDHETFSMPEFIVCLGFFGIYLFEMTVHHFLVDRRGGEAAAAGSVNDETTPCLGGEADDHHHHLSELSLGAVLTFSALSFHSFFEGFAVGLRPDWSSTLLVFFAVAVHKFVLAFVVGMQFVAESTSRQRAYLFVSVAIFAITSPIGMAIAMATEVNLEDSSPLTISVLNAVATGTIEEE